MEMTPRGCFTVSHSLVLAEAICLHSLSAMAEEGTALSPLLLTPRVPMLLCSDLHLLE